jgi:predicted ATP-dependent serine protease
MRSGAPAGRTPFVGREKEPAELIGGEPGVGKTRLAYEILDEARRLNAACLVGHCL